MAELSDDQREEAIDEILTFMGLADLEPAYGLEALAASRPIFDRAIPYALLDMNLGWDEQELFADARAKDLNTRLDVRMLTIDAPGVLTLQRAKRVEPPEVRGQVTAVFPNMVEHSACWIDKATGKGETTRSIWGEVSPLQWRRVDNFPIGWRETPEQSSQRLNLAHGMQFTARYQWTVYLAAPPYPGLLIPTSPAGILEAWKMRDLPEGTSRRAALRHLVHEHWRKRSDEEQDRAAILVREHFRGAEAFRWNGLVARITPSAFDKERIAKGPARA